MESKLITEFKYLMWVLKYTPIVLAITNFMYLFLQFLSIDLAFVGGIIGIGFLPLTFLIIASFVFKFCVWHRLPLYYLGVMQAFCLFDFYVGIPLTLFGLLTLHTFLFIILVILLIKFKT